MKYILALAVGLALVLAGLGLQPAQAQGGQIYTVQQGDTLTAIASYYGISVDELLAANGLGVNTWVYAGHQLLIPSPALAPVAQTYSQPAQASPAVQTYSRPALSTLVMVTVQPGETMSSIATKHGISINQLAAANGLAWNAWIYAGQQLLIPATESFPVDNQPAPPVAQPAPQSAPTHSTASQAERWVDVNLTTQTVTAYEGNTPVRNVLASTGRWQYPTVVGTYKIYVKYEKARMRGGIGADAYDLPDVPYVMYFYRGYGLHGTYWHNNFGTPMSHGCVNLSISDSEWFFNWASIGTKVVTHY